MRAVDPPQSSLRAPGTRRSCFSLLQRRIFRKIRKTGGRIQSVYDLVTKRSPTAFRRRAGSGAHCVFGTCGNGTYNAPSDGSDNIE
jgi:hypothetical protein